MHVMERREKEKRPGRGFRLRCVQPVSLAW